MKIRVLCLGLHVQRGKRQERLEVIREVRGNKRGKRGKRSCLTLRVCGSAGLCGVGRFVAVEWSSEKYADIAEVCPD